jgi:hypothetical protein
MAPPRRALVLDLDAEAVAAVPAALLAAGYVAETHEGRDTLARGGEDHAMSLADRNPADPFGGDLGYASRVVIEGSTVVQTNEWPLLLDLTEPASPGPELEVMAAALDLPDWGGASVVQAQLWTSPFDFAAPPPAVATLGAEGAATLEVAPASATPTGIPPWSLALAADLAAPDGALALVLLVYGDRGSAETAAASLLESYTAARSLVMQRPLSEAIGAEATTQVTGDGPFVTVLALRASPGGDPGRPFAALRRAWEARDLGILGPG